MTNTYLKFEDRYKLIRLLGQGASAQAFEVKEKTT